jgi:hypothetical protein
LTGIRRDVSWSNTLQRRQGNLRVLTKVIAAEEGITVDAKRNAVLSGVALKGVISTCQDIATGE